MKTYDPKRHHRRNIRLKGYDYSQPGAYFLTICTYRHELIFGGIVNGEMILNQCAETVLKCWHDLTNYCQHIELSAFVVMPNHVHGIVVIKDVGTDPGSVPAKPVKAIKRYSLPEIVRIFKTSSSRRINSARGTVGTPVWQRNYWEHVIRNQEAFNRICDYIVTNPKRWYLDRENPDRMGEDDFDRWLNCRGG